MLSSLARNSQEPKLKRSFEILWVFFEKMSVFYSDWPKSWIWRTLEKVLNILCKWHFHNASKEVFWPQKFLNFIHGFILAEWKYCQNGTFEPVHEIQIFFGQKHSFEALWKCQLKTFFISCPRVRQIQDLCRKKYKKGIF